MPRIHSWQEVIAPRDCWCIPPCAPPRAPPPVPPAASNPHRVPLGSHRPLHPPPWRNEQRAISLLLNACHKSPRAPSRSPSSRAHPPPATLSRFSPLFHLFSPEDSTLTCTTPHLVSCFLWLNFSALCFIAFILRVFFVSFPSYPGFLPSHWRLKKRKRKWRKRRVPILHFLRHLKRKIMIRGYPCDARFFASMRHCFFSSSCSLFFLLHRVLIRLRSEGSDLKIQPVGWK